MEHRLKILHTPRSLLVWVLLSLVQIGVCQTVRPSFVAGWGGNLLTSPGTELRSFVGRTGYVGAGVEIGEGKIIFHPRVSFLAANFRTEMANRLYFVSRRSAFDLELLAGFRQMNRTLWLIGVFGGKVSQANAFIEQDRQNVVTGAALPALRARHLETRERAGVLGGLRIPLGSAGRLALDIMLRQHLIPLVEEDQYHALPFQPEQLVLHQKTLATEFTIGLGYLIKKADDDGKSP